MTVPVSNISPGTLPPGTELRAGRYRLDDVVGQGAFGITYRATDALTGLQVAVKECFPAGCAREGFEVVPSGYLSQVSLERYREQFRHQATLLTGIHHLHLLNVQDHWEENGTVYLSTNWVRGQNLLSWLEENRRADLQTGMEWLAALAGAVGAMHSAGVLHLDIKPGNVILGPFGPVLIDFDLARLTGADDHSTRPLALAMRCGTPGYAPMEQYAQGGVLSTATDIYALGATAYHLLTGREPPSAPDRALGFGVSGPYRAGVEGGVLQALEEFGRGEGREEIWFAAWTGLPPEVDEALRWAMQPRPEDRPSTAREFLERLCQKPPGDEQSQANAPQVTSVPPRPASGYYRVALAIQEPAWPDHCACCFARPETDYALRAPGREYHVPLCQFCARHQHVVRTAGRMTFWGIFLSVLLGFASIAASSAYATIWPLALGTVGVFLNFAALIYGALKNSRADDLMGSQCTDVGDPVTMTRLARGTVWRLRNGKFAVAFRKLNEGDLL